MIRGVGELIPNFDHETLLSACFRDSEKEQHKILAKQVLNYVINTPSENKKFSSDEIFSLLKDSGTVETFEK